jgi:hypothetical protein
MTMSIRFIYPVIYPAGVPGQRRAAPTGHGSGCFSYPDDAPMGSRNSGVQQAMGNSTRMPRRLCFSYDVPAGARNSGAGERAAGSLPGMPAAACFSY